MTEVRQDLLRPGLRGEQAGADVVREGAVRGAVGPGRVVAAEVGHRREQLEEEHVVEHGHEARREERRDALDVLDELLRRVQAVDKDQVIPRIEGDGSRV